MLKYTPGILQMMELEMVFATCLTEHTIYQCTQKYNNLTEAKITF